jgi:hypothetical protein
VPTRLVAGVDHALPQLTAWAAAVVAARRRVGELESVLRAGTRSAEAAAAEAQRKLVSVNAVLAEERQQAVRWRTSERGPSLHPGPLLLAPPPRIHPHIAHTRFSGCALLLTVPAPVAACCVHDGTAYQLHACMLRAW